MSNRHWSETASSELTEMIATDGSLTCVGRPHLMDLRIPGTADLGVRQRSELGPWSFGPPERQLPETTCALMTRPHERVGLLHFRRFGRDQSRTAQSEIAVY